MNPSQNTPVLPNMRRIVMRPSGASCSLRNAAKLSLATILYPFGLARGCSVIASMLPSPRPAAILLPHEVGRVDEHLDCDRSVYQGLTTFQRAFPESLM